jgi:hypothetical protein
MASELLHIPGTPIRLNIQDTATSSKTLRQYCQQRCGVYKQVSKHVAARVANPIGIFADISDASVAAAMQAMP